MGTSDYSGFLSQKSQKFYSDISKSQTMKEEKFDDLFEKIQLKASINKINNNCIYHIQFFSLINNERMKLNEHSECSILNNDTVNLNSSIIIKYYFEKEQNLLIEILKIENGISKKYEIRTTLGCIMGSRKNTFQKNISTSEPEMIVLQAEKLKQSEDVISIRFEVQPNKPVDFKEIKCKSYFEILSNDKLLYRSESLNNKGIFDPVKIPLFLFKDNKITLLFYSFNRNVKRNYTLSTYEFANQKEFEFKMRGTNYKVLSRSAITKDYTFVDYLKAGVQIGLAIAIDFTGSNGNPNDPNSLHYINDQIPNQYERAIYSCGNIVAYYDYDQLFPCFGFGAKINNEPNILFNLNMKQDPNIKFIEGVIEEYHNTIKVVTLWGPTFFSPIIKTIKEFIKKEKKNIKYHILMILTDGIIDDMDDTIEELVEASFLPLSVIIIGVGHADFSNMIELDSDENLLINSKGVRASRDIVQFVPFSKYESNPDYLAMEVLAEIPRQVVDYYEQNNIQPIYI